MDNGEESSGNVLNWISQKLGRRFHRRSIITEPAPPLSELPIPAQLTVEPTTPPKTATTVSTPSPETPKPQPPLNPSNLETEELVPRLQGAISDPHLSDLETIRAELENPDLSNEDLTALRELVEEQLNGLANGLPQSEARLLINEIRRRQKEIGRGVPQSSYQDTYPKERPQQIRHFKMVNGRWQEVSSAPENIISATRPGGYLEHRGAIPSTVTSWESTNIRLVVDQNQLFYLNPAEAYQTSLDLLTIQPDQGPAQQVLLGVVMTSDLQKELMIALNLRGGKHLPDGQLHALEQLFFIELHRLLSHRMINKVVTGRSRWPILCATNGRAGDRVYLADAGTIEDHRVFLVICASTKSRQRNYIGKLAKAEKSGRK